MDLNLLTLFVTVVDATSLSAAARKLDLPVSSVSRGLTRLEESLQTQLLLRTTRRMSLTPAGKTLYERIAPMVTSIANEVDKTLGEDEAPAGDLRITAPVELGPAFLADAVARFLVRYPEIRVDVYLSNQVLDLAKEGIDAALRFSGRRLRDSSLVAKRLSPLVGHLYASPSYLARRGAPRTAAELGEHEWVVFSPMARDLELTGPDGRRERLHPRGRVSSNEILYLRELVRAGLGVGFLPTFLAEDDVAAGRLTRVLPRATLDTGSLWFVRPAARHTPARVDAFRDFIADYLRTHPIADGAITP